MTLKAVYRCVSVCSIKINRKNMGHPYYHMPYFRRADHIFWVELQWISTFIQKIKLFMMKEVLKKKQNKTIIKFEVVYLTL